jgi:hypothetical protein
VFEAEFPALIVYLPFKFTAAFIAAPALRYNPAPFVPLGSI